MTRDAQLAGGDAGNLFNEFRITRSAKTDIVREDGGTSEIGVSVNRINAPDDRNGNLNTGRVNRGSIVRVCGIQPALRVGIGQRAGRRVAAA